MKQVKPIYGQDYAPGYTLFTKKTNLLSRGISWFENLQEANSFSASHVILVINETIGIESSIFGVEYCNLIERFEQEDIMVVCREPDNLDSFTREQIFTKAIIHEKQETPYDYSGLIFGYTSSILFGFTKWIKPLRKYPIPFHWPKSFVCSGFVADCYKHANKYNNIPLFQEWHISRISPNLLWNGFTYKNFRYDKEKEVIS